MFSQKIFDLAVNCVENTIGYPFLGHSHKATLVDARSILVCILKDYGMSEGDLAKYMNISQQGVNKLYNNATYRFKSSQLLKRYYEMANNEFTTTLQRIRFSHN